MSAPPRTVCASASSSLASSRLRAAWPARTGREVDDAADRHGDGDEQQQRQQVVRLVDGERVQRRGEVPVEQQAGGGGGEHGRPEAADHRERDHGDQVDQQVVGQAQVRPGRDQQGGQQRQADRGEQDPQQRPAGADGVGRIRHQATAVRRGPAARQPLTAVTGRPGTRAGPRGIATCAHAFQYGPVCQPAHEQAEGGPGQRARGHDDGGVRGMGAGQPQLCVRRMGEPHRGEPSDDRCPGGSPRAAPPRMTMRSPRPRSRSAPPSPRTGRAGRPRPCRWPAAPRSPSPGRRAPPVPAGPPVHAASNRSSQEQSNAGNGEK